MDKPGRTRRPRAATLVLCALLFCTALPSTVRALPGCPEALLRPLLDTSGAPRPLPHDYRPGAVLVRDDPDRTLESTLVELARRSSGRKMLERLVDSGFVTVLVSRRLRPMQAGLWGPIFFRGRPVGASLYLDLEQIRGLDHDPTGVETLAHELRHQVDAARAFVNKGTYEAIYRAAANGDRTLSAQRYGRRVRRQRPDLTAAEARRWLAPLLERLPADDVLMARAGYPTTAD